MLLFICTAITNAIANALGSEPPRFVVESTQPNGINAKVFNATMVDVPVAFVLTVLIVFGVF